MRPSRLHHHLSDEDISGCARGYHATAQSGMQQFSSAFTPHFSNSMHERQRPPLFIGESIGILIFPPALWILLSILLVSSSSVDLRTIKCLPSPHWSDNTH